jgi:hypothetical protein
VATIVTMGCVSAYDNMKGETSLVKPTDYCDIIASCFFYDVISNLVVLSCLLERGDANMHYSTHARNAAVLYTRGCGCCYNTVC